MWQEFSRDLMLFINSKVKNSDDTEDIFQDVFFKICKNIDKLNDTKVLKSWIYTITRNTIIDFYKKKKDILVPQDSLLDIKDIIENENNMNDHIINCIKKMKHNLPDKYKQVYDMFESQNMTHKQICESLNISLSTSKVRLKRSKEILKKNLIECCDFDLDKYGNITNYYCKKDCVCGSKC